MRSKAVRLYGKKDLRLEEFELLEIRDDEILAQVISDSMCMSSYKAAIQGADHKRVPADIFENPIIVGHEFCGRIVEVGTKWQGKFKKGDRFSIQPALNLKEDPYAAPGYSFRHIGGSATYIIIPNVVMESGSLLPYQGKAYFYGSLAEPMSCIVGAFNASYHTTQGSYIHKMGIVEGGNLAILAGAGPMGLGAIDYAINNPHKRPGLIVVTDIDDSRLKRAQEVISVEQAEKKGIKLIYINTSEFTDPVGPLMSITNGEGYNDVFVFAPVKPVVEMGDKLLSQDGCLNFFAGPSNTKFTAELNFYNVHYSSTHIVGTSGRNTEDMKESLDLMADGTINPAAMITHIGGLNSVVNTILNLPEIPGGKKLIYTNINLELTALTDFAAKGKDNPMFASLADITEKNN
ncbi:MAG: zinc-binding dehydrogenase [Clostridiaceae bacterium]|nr:zinc-binding dehydrogenase [Clostridiaceae bacterium]